MDSNKDFILRIIDDIRRGKPDSIDAYLKKIEYASVIDGTKTIFYGHIINLDANGKARTEDFIAFIARHIVSYVIPRSRIEEAHKKDREEGLDTHVARLAEDARRLFTPLKNTGEGGEMLLFILGEVVLGLPQLFCKMSVKTSGKMHFHGADGVHVDFKDETLNLYWGESKLYKSFSSALKKCLESISPILNKKDDADHEDLLLLQTHLDLGNPEHTKMIKHFLNKDSPEFNSVKYCGLCLIGFNKDIYSTTTTSAIIESHVKEWKKEIGEQLKNTKLTEFSMHFFCLPVECVDNFRKIFLQKLGVT